MKLYKLISIFLLITITTLYSSQEKNLSQDSAERKSPFDFQLIKFPPKEILRTQLESIGFGDFDEQTGLINELHLKKPSKNPIGVAMIVEQAYQKFEDTARQNNTPDKEIMEVIEKKSLLFETLCEDHTQGLKEIAKTGLYQPKKRVLIKALSL